MIIIALLSRWCWNWQTGMVEGHVTKVVEVQVLSSAQSRIRGFFYFIFPAAPVYLRIDDID